MSKNSIGNIMVKSRQKFPNRGGGSTKFEKIPSNGGKGVGVAELGKSSQVTG